MSTSGSCRSRYAAASTTAASNTAVLTVMKSRPVAHAGDSLRFL